MAGSTQNQQFEIRIITSAAGAFDPIQLGQIEAIANDLAAHIGEQLALLVGQRRGFLQYAGAADVIDHQLTLLLTRLKHQLAVSRGQLPLHSCLSDVRSTFALAIEQLAGGKQRQQGNNDQRTGDTHLWLSRQVSPRYAA